MNNTWWNEKEQYFYSRVGKDHKLEGRGGGNLPYWGIVDDGPKLKSAISGAGSRYLEVFYRYGDPDAAREQLLETMTPGRSRMEYPEVPYSVIATVVNGTMGINLETSPAQLSSVEGFGWKPPSGLYRAWETTSRGPNCETCRSVPMKSRCGTKAAARPCSPINRGRR